MDPSTVGWIVGIAVVVIAVVFLVVTRRRDNDPLGSGRSAQLPVPPAISLTAAELDELREVNGRAGKINAIKRLREMRTVSLADAKKVVDVLAAGGSLPTSPTPSPGRPGGPDQSSSTTTTQTLADRARLLRDEAGPIHAIKYVREQTGMGLAEAKAFVDALR